MARIYSEPWSDYELLDAGGSKKLERWGEVITIRPERNAYFRSVKPFTFWQKKAHFEFEEEEDHQKGQWKRLKPDAPTEWFINYRDIRMKLQLTKYKHLGFFPEQQINWEYIAKKIGKNDRFLNLFGYTGAASLVARSVGGDVFHCDSVRQVINWGKENMEASGLSDIHWVLEDALKFAQREVKRGNRYKGIIMDPPAFGIGAGKERWKIENRFPELLKIALDLRQEDGFIIANTYSPKLDVKDVVEIVKNLAVSEKCGVDTLCMKTGSGKLIEYGQRTLIEPV
ncbi:MAG: class I SAM-dependent methyltransferase [Crocinitomicaceae bacterium]